MKNKKIRIALFILLVGAVSFIVAKTYERSHEGHSHEHHESEEGSSNEHESHDHEAHEDGEKHGDHEESEEESVGGVGKNNAVTAANEDTGIRLSEKAIEAIGLKTIPYTEGTFPRSALVYYQNNVGTYRLRDGWFKLVPVQIQNGDSTSLSSSDLVPGDHVVVAGTGLLRAAELDAFSSETGHSH